MPSEKQQELLKALSKLISNKNKENVSIKYWLYDNKLDIHIV